MKHGIWGFMLAAVCLLIGCAGPQGKVSDITTAQSEVAYNLKCAIELSKSEFKAGEPVLISVVVRNLSGLAVDAAFWGLQTEEPIVNFQIRGPSGQPLLVSTKQNLWCGTGVGNTAIPTGREHRFSVDLLKTWEWGGAETKLPAGSYMVFAELFSQTTNGGRPKVAESEEVTFTVVSNE